MSIKRKMRLQVLLYFEQDANQASPRVPTVYLKTKRGKLLPLQVISWLLPPEDCVSETKGKG